MELYELYKAYKRSRRGKRRSADQVQFELDRFSRLSRLCDALNRRTYTPDANYCFIHKREKSREVWASEVELKIVQTMLDDRLRPFIEAELTDRTFNNRVGMGTHAAINRVIEDVAEVSEGYTEDAWIVKIDLKGYFPNIDQDIAWKMTSGLIERNITEGKDELLYLARIANYVNPQFRAQRRTPIHRWSEEIPRYKSLYDKPFGTGAAIGFLYWQVVSNYYLNEVDKWIIGNITPHYTRFVDDMVMVVRSKTALRMLPALREKLAETGVTMHPHKFYCQHYTKGVEFLGYHVNPHSIHLNRKIVKRAFEAKPCGRNKFVCRVNSYLGMMKRASDDRLKVALLDSITRKGIGKDYAGCKVKATDGKRKRKKCSTNKQ